MAGDYTLGKLGRQRRSHGLSRLLAAASPGGAGGHGLPGPLVHVEATGSICLAMSSRRSCARKGLERCILITDATHVATLAPGTYRLAGVAIGLLDCGKVIRADGACLGGSALSMDRAVAGFMALSGACLADALRAASENPARLLGGRGLCRAVSPGEPANLFSFEHEAGGMRVAETFIAGTQTF